MPYFYFDYSYLIIVMPAVLLALWAQVNVKGTFNKYSRCLSSRGLTGAETARQILQQNGLYNVDVVRIEGDLNDHYDPQKKVIRLSTGVYDSSSVASIGVAAHEAGHAVQHSTGYVPLYIRNAIIPATQFSSSLSIPLILIGFFMSSRSLVFAGIILFAAAVLFQIITLPVEFNASARALRTLDGSGILYGEELNGAKKVLRAAALTYVAATIVALANLLRLLFLFGGMRSRDD